MSEEKRKKLIKLAHKLSYKEGNFTLASGKKSRFYLDLKELTLSQEGLQLIGELACEKMEQHWSHIHAVGGMTLGADPLAVAIILEAAKHKQKLAAFIIRKAEKDHGISRPMEGTQRFPKGAKVLVLEDVTTTGGSALQAIRILQNGGFQVEGLLTVVDREEGARNLFDKEKIPFHSLCTLEEVRTSNK